MDPNATLKEMRDIAGNVPHDGPPDLVRLADLFEELDSWMGRNGSLPDDWLPDEPPEREF